MTSAGERGGERLSGELALRDEAPGGIRGEPAAKRRHAPARREHDRGGTVRGGAARQRRTRRGRAAGCRAGRCPGRSSADRGDAGAPSAASPTTSKPLASSSARAAAGRAAWSSTISTVRRMIELSQSQPDSIRAIPRISRSAAQVGEHGEHAAVVVRRVSPIPSLSRMWRTCVSTVFGLRKSCLQMPSFEWPSAIRASTSRSRVGELVERALLARSPDEPRDDRRVEDALALVDALRARRRAPRGRRRAP